METQSRGRWELYGGRDPRDVPSYATWEAARYLRLPIRTVQNWAFGFGSYGGRPLIRIADPERHMLSFWNVAEMHVLRSLRRYHQITPKTLRHALRYLEETFDSPHPLLTEKMVTDGVSVLVEQTGGALINAGKYGQLSMKGMLEAHLHRIEQDLDGIAITLFPFVRHGSDSTITPEALIKEPKIISIDPRVRFGRPVIIGTSIPTSEIAERFRAGDSFDALAEEYGRPSKEIEEAIRCEFMLDAGSKAA